jgi:hypothetical protein
VFDVLDEPYEIRRGILAQLHIVKSPRGSEGGRDIPRDRATSPHVPSRERDSWVEDLLPRFVVVFSEIECAASS